MIEDRSGPSANTSRRAVLALCTLALGALAVQGCSKGSGSDIGPKLGPVPLYDYRVLVQDDTGKPIVGAKISVSGAVSSAVTCRTGRAFLHERIVGARRVTVDGANAAANDASRFGACTVAAMLPDGDELPYVLYLPDHGPSVGRTISTGVQASASILDDDDTTVTTRSGANVTVIAGDTVKFAAASSVELRTGKLSVGHLPRTLAEGGAAVLASRAIYIHPAGVTSTVGFTLSIPDDIGLGSGELTDVYWLDPATGSWAKVGKAVESGGRIVASGALGSIRTGGLYSIGKAGIATTAVSGRVLDVNDFAIPGALVRGPQASTRTAFDGRFTLPVPSNRDTMLAVHGGRGHLPTGISVPVAKADLGGAVYELPNPLVLDAPPATNLRFLMLHRGATITNRRLSVSARGRISDASAVLDDRGIVRFEEIAADVIGYLHTMPVDILAIIRARNILLLRPGPDNATNIFPFELPWRWAPIGGTAIETMDKTGTGALFLAHVIRGDVPGQGFFGQTDLNGYFGIGVFPNDSLTTVFRSDLDGRTVTSAFTAEEPGVGRIEMPLERANRQFGDYDRFGVVAGDLTGLAASTTKTRRIRATGKMTRQDFFDLAAFGRARPGGPTLVAPTPMSPAFRIGVPGGMGHLAAVEGTTTGGVFHLERLGVVLDVTAAEGEQTPLDIPLTPISAGGAFRIRNALLNKDPGLAMTDLRFHVAGELSTGLIVDLAGDVGLGAGAISGNDVLLPLPPRPAGIGQYWVVLGGAKMAGGVIAKQCIAVRLREGSSPDVAQLALPTIVSPLPGATVPKIGFTVKFNLPAECQYGVVTIRSEKTTNGKTDVRDWTVVVPRTRVEADFFTFQTVVPQLLVDAEDRTWSLTVAAARIDTGSLIDPVLVYRRTYVRILANWTGIKEYERGVRAFSSVTQTFETKK